MMNIKKVKTVLVMLLAIPGLLLPVMAVTAGTAFAGVPGDPTGSYSCGTGTNKVYTSIDICTTSPHLANPIMDAFFNIIKFLTDGVGLVVVGSLVFAGIQYSASAGDPQSTSKAIGRIRQSLIALLIFIFGFAILNYVIPKGFLR